MLIEARGPARRSWWRGLGAVGWWRGQRQWACGGWGAPWGVGLVVDEQEGRGGERGRARAVCGGGGVHGCCLGVGFG